MRLLRHEGAASVLAMAMALGVAVGPAQGDGAFAIFADSFETPVVTGRTPDGGTMAPGWTRSDGRVGLWNEDSGTMSTPHGAQAAWVWSDRSLTTSSNSLSESLTAGVTYTLTFNVAAENGAGGIQYAVDLLSGTNVLASASGGPLTSADLGATSGMVSFAASPGHSQLEKPLAIRLRYVSGDWHYVLAFDNIRLVAAESREAARTLFYGK